MAATPSLEEPLSVCRLHRTGRLRQEGLLLQAELLRVVPLRAAPLLRVVLHREDRLHLREDHLHPQEGRLRPQEDLPRQVGLLQVVLRLAGPLQAGHLLEVLRAPAAIRLAALRV